MGKSKINNPQVQELLESIGEIFPQEILYEFDGEMHIIKLNTETVTSKIFKHFICNSEIQEKVSQKAQSIIFVSDSDRGNFFTENAITIPKKEGLRIVKNWNEVRLSLNTSLLFKHLHQSANYKGLSEQQKSIIISFSNCETAAAKKEQTKSILESAMKFLKTFTESKDTNLSISK